MIDSVRSYFSGEDQVKTALTIGLISGILLASGVVLLYFTSIFEGEGLLITTQIWTSIVTSTILITVYSALVLYNKRQVGLMSEQSDHNEDMRGIERDQTELLKSQNKLYQAQYKPIVAIDDVAVRGDDLYLTLSNRGNGIANNLRVETNIDIKDSDQEVENATVILRRSHSNHTKNYLSGNEDEIVFECIPQAQYFDENGRGSIDRNINSILKMAGESKMLIRIVLKYDNILNEGQRTTIQSKWVVGSESTNLKRIIS